MKIKQKARQTLCGLVAFLASALPLKAMDLEAGLQYNQEKTKPYVTISQAYKKGKIIFIGEAEKVREAPLALRIRGIYPLGKGYSISGFEQVGVDPSLEPLYYLTSASLGKRVGKGSVSVGASGFKSANSNNISYSGSLFGSYKIGKKTEVKGLTVVPIKSPSKPTVKVGVGYTL